ncbi:MAG: hypothetical protein MI919_07885 [Holophagales bacterium]|nr:hypothetical protein [Holophagales bacterium]
MKHAVSISLGSSSRDKRVELKLEDQTILMERIGCDRQSVLLALAREHGVDLGPEIDAGQWLIPFTYRRLPVLHLHALELEFPHEPPEQVTYVGPMVLRTRKDRPMGAGDRARLSRVLGHVRENSERRLLYAGFGSAFTAAGDLVERLVRVVAERPEWHLVLSLGGRAATSELGPLPERVHAFPWLPQLRVLRHAHAAITHGGINTIDECVLHGVPMLVYCGGETDMAGNTARVVHHGLGLAGDPRRDRTEDIARRVERLLEEPAFRQRVGEMRRRFLIYRRQRVAEGAVDRLLAMPRGKS